MWKLMVCVSALLVLLGTLSDSSLAKPCCTEYTKKPVRVKVLKAYVLQENTGFCNIKAVIFKTVKNRFLCADPEKRWVKRAMKSVLRRRLSTP